ncbi:MAG: hypothetical protein HQ472_04890 [Ignavibacteria bacterium]|nr:hypothetical protein [Ignavibacteria bacterium]
MNFNYAVLKLIVFVYGFGVTIPALAQEWRQLPGTYLSKNNNKGSAGIAESITFDTCSRRFFHIYGQECVSSADLGKNWKQVSRDQRITISKFQRLSGDGCVQFVHWEDKSRGHQTWVARYIESADSLAIVSSPDDIRLYDVTGSSGAVVALLSALDNSSGLVSIDTGRTWNARYSKLRSSTNQLNLMLRPKPGVLAAYFTDEQGTEGWWEFHPDKPAPQYVPVPVGTFYYSYVNDTVIVYGIANNELNRTSILGFHNVVDSTVRILDTIYCENTGKRLSTSAPDGSIQRYSVAAIRVGKLGAITVWFERGDILSSTDGGHTWYNRNPTNPKNSRDLDYNTTRHISAQPDGSYFFVLYGRVAYLAGDITKPIQYLSPPMAVRMLAYGDGVLLAGTLINLLRSDDSGRTWMQTGIAPELVEFHTSPFNGAHYTALEHISPVDSTEIYAASAATGHLWKYRQEHKQWQALRYLTADWESTTPGTDPAFHTTSLSANPSRIIKAGKRGALWFNDFGLNEQHLVPDTLVWNFPLVGGYRSSGINSYVIIDSLYHAAFADSLYLSNDGGVTWYIGGKGLPQQDNGDLVPCSNIVVLGSGEWIAGLRGLIIVTDTTDNVGYRGSMWVSRDKGVTWSSTAPGLDTNTCVWNITMLADSTTLVASIGMNARTPDFSVAYRHSMSNGRIVRSTDAGATWADVYLETRSQPSYTGRRKILQHRDGRVIAATMEQGVIQSHDSGQTWLQVGNETLLGRFINDIAIDTMGLVYASTDRGVYYFVPGTTSVDEPTEGFRISTLWCYPTPATDRLRIRVNNLQLYRGWQSLKLYNILGGTETSFTTALQQAVNQQPMSQRFEFDVDISNVPRGVYILALEGSGTPLTMKVFRE